MPQLTERCDIWRWNNTYGQQRQLAVLWARVPCLKVPLSSFDKVASALAARDTGSSETFRAEARISTDAFLLPASFQVQVEDELRRGRRTDTTGTVQPYRYIVNGLRDYETFGYQDTIAVFCSLFT